MTGDSIAARIDSAGCNLLHPLILVAEIPHLKRGLAMAKRKTSNDRITDIDAKRTDGHKKRPGRVASPDSSTDTERIPVATQSGIQLCLTNGETVVLPPRDPVIWDRMWDMLYEKLKPLYTQYMEEEERQAKHRRKRSA